MANRIQVLNTSLPVYERRGEEAHKIRPEVTGLYDIVDCNRALGLYGLYLYSSELSLIEEKVLGVYSLAQNRASQLTDAGILIVGNVFPYDQEQLRHVRGVAVLSNEVSYHEASAGSPFHLM
jgi:hypothetical protein